MNSKSSQTPFILAAVAFAGFPASLLAQTPITWDGDTDNDFATGTNWVGDVAPADDLTSNIAELKGGSVTLDTGDRSVAGLDFDLGTNLSGANTLSVGTSGINVSQNSVLSAGLLFNNNAVINVQGGRLSLANTSAGAIAGTGQLTISGNNTAFFDGSNNTYSGGTVITSGARAAGKSINSFGSGAILLDGGTFSSNGGAIDTGGRALTLTANGGTLATNGARIGVGGSTVISGAGALTIGAGNNIVYLDNTNTFTGDIIVQGTLGAKGAGSLGAGNVQLDGGEIFANGANIDTGSRVITLTSNGGTLRSNGGRRIGVGGIITGSGQLTADGSNNVYLDNAGNDYSGGTLVKGLLRPKSDGSLGAVTGAITFDAGGNGVIETNNGTINMDAARNINMDGDGVLNASNRDITVNGDISGVGKLTLEGNNVVYLNGENTHSGGTDITTFVQVANGDEFGSGAVTIDGGRLKNNNSTPEIANDVTLGAGGGRFQAGWNKDITLNGVVGGSGDLTLEGDSGTLVLGGNNTYTGNTILQDGNSKIEVTGTLGGGSYGGVISGDGTLEYAGSGTQALTGSNTYTGETTVSSGTLVINGSISTSTLTTVESGATIGGDGATGALTVSAGGFHNPGNSPGTMTVNGDYTMAGTLTAEITGITPGVGGHDQVIVNGAVDLTGGDLVTAFSGSGYVDGDMLAIILNDGVDAVTGTFNGLAEGASVVVYDGLEWLISYEGGDGNDVVLTGFTIPEPSVSLLAGLGALALLRRRRA